MNAFQGQVDHVLGFLGQGRMRGRDIDNLLVGMTDHVNFGLGGRMVNFLGFCVDRRLLRMGALLRLGHLLLVRAGAGDGNRSC